MPTPNTVIRRLYSLVHASFEKYLWLFQLPYLTHGSGVIEVLHHNSMSIATNRLWYLHARTLLMLHSVSKAHREAGVVKLSEVGVLLSSC